MYPLVSCRLAHPKQIPLDDLQRVSLLIHQDEQQLLLHALQDTPSPATCGALARVSRQHLVTNFPALVSRTERWQQHIEFFESQTRECQKLAAILLQHRELKHSGSLIAITYNVYWAC